MLVVDPLQPLEGVLSQRQMGLSWAEQLVALWQQQDACEALSFGTYWVLRAEGQKLLEDQSEEGAAWLRNLQVDSLVKCHFKTEFSWNYKRQGGIVKQKQGINDVYHTFI